MVGVARALVGAVTTTTAVVAARMGGASSTVRVKYSPNADMSSASFTGYNATDDNYYVKIVLTGLSPNTRYYTQIEADGVLDTSWGQNKLKTAPTTQTTWQFCFFGCTDEQASPGTAAWLAMANHDPAFTMCLGDFTYVNSNTDPTRYLPRLEALLGCSNVRTWMRSGPFERVWDDHDWGNDNSSGGIANAAYVAEFFRATMPHYPLPDTTGAVYHAFTWGRLRFIMLDSRHDRDPDSASQGTQLGWDSGSVRKTMLGATQRQWVKDRLLEFQNDSSVELCIIGNPQCWIANSTIYDPNHTPSADISDSWGKYHYERQDLAKYIAANVTKQVIQVASDMHGIALDDGTNADYVDDGTVKAYKFPGTTTPYAYAAPMVIAQAGAMHQQSNTKGGPYSKGSPVAGSNHYGLCTITDSGSLIHVKIEMMEVDPNLGTETATFTHEWDVLAGAPPPPLPPPPPDFTAPVFDKTGHQLTVVDAAGHSIEAVVG